MYLIILPVKNESKTVLKTTKEILDYCKGYFLKNYQVLFVDDGSTDGTFEILKSIKSDNLRVIKNSFDNGKGSALKVGYVISNLLYRLRDDDSIIFLDGDGQVDINEIKTFINIRSLYNSDVVVGNKRHDYSVVYYSLKRKIVSETYNFMVRILFGIKLRDTQCGIKLFYKYSLDKVISKITIKRFAFDLELLVALREQNMRVSDCPVKIKRQLNGGSVSINNIINVFIDTVIVWFKKKRGFYSCQK